MLFNADKFLSHYWHQMKSIFGLDLIFIKLSARPWLHKSTWHIETRHKTRPAYNFLRAVMEVEIDDIETMNFSSQLCACVYEQDLEILDCRLLLINMFR